MSMDMKKDRITELNHRQKVRFSTILLPLCSMATALSVNLSRYKINIHEESL